MRIKAVRLFTLLAIGSVLLTGCVSNTEEVVSHKPKTSGCLITTESEAPGTPNRQLAADLVEAQVVYGLKVREIAIPVGNNVMARLLKELQAGCVLMVSSNPKFLNPLASFARLHPKMLVLFMGSNIAIEDQPANFRWIADDVSSAASLAGFAAAELGQPVKLFVQPKYWLIDEMEAGFRAGVREYSSVTGNQVSLTVAEVNTDSQLKLKLQGLVEPSVVVLFAGKSIWAGIEDYSNITVISSNLQFGKTLSKIDPKVVGSIERNSRLYVLRAVSSLLTRKFNSKPPFQEPAALQKGLVLFRSVTPISQELTDYRQRLISALNK